MVNMVGKLASMSRRMPPPAQLRHEAAVRDGERDRRRVLVLEQQAECPPLVWPVTHRRLVTRLVRENESQVSRSSGRLSLARAATQWKSAHDAGSRGACAQSAC